MEQPCTELPFFYYSHTSEKWTAFDRANKWEASQGARGREREVDLGRHMVVLQYNIWFGEFQYRRRMEAIIAEMERLGADLVNVQEMKPHMLKVFLQSPLVRSSYFISDITGSTLGSYGVVQFSRFPYHRLTLNAMVTRLGRKALVGEFLLPSAPEGLQCSACGVLQSTEEEKELGEVHCGCARPPSSRTRTSSIDSVRSDSDTGLLSGEEEYEEDITAFVDPPIQRNILAVATAHLESYPQDVSYRRAQMLRVFDILQPFAHAIFTADFNFAEKGEDGFFPENYVDCWKALHPDEEGYTFDSTANPLIREQTKKRARIDRILVKSSHWKASKCEIIGTKPFDGAYPLLLPSDHFGVSAVLECTEQELP